MDILREDCMFSEILEERKSLTGFLDAVFGFLRRKTDFYHIQRTKDEKLGFPPGIKEQVLLSSMQKYEKYQEPSNASNNEDVPPPAVEEVEIESSEILSDIEVPMPNVDSTSETIQKPSVNFTENEYKNGSLCGKYCWSQTLKDVEVSLQLPAEVKTSKHLRLILKSNYISVTAVVPTEMELLSGSTWDRYKHNDVVWTIVDGKLVLSFDKAKECWWDKLFTHEISIDIKKLDTYRSIEEYPQETQRAIEKIELEGMTEKSPANLKTLTMSQSEQLSRLKQAWNAEDSPFKGQTFDPSIIQF